MTQELLTALGAGKNAELSGGAETGKRIATPVTRSLVRNDSVGDGLPDVPQPRSGDRQRAVEGASPYEADRRSPVGDGLPDVPQPGSGDRQRAVEGASPYEAQGDSVGAAARSAQSEALSSRTGAHTGVAIRSSDAETGKRIATPNPSVTGASTGDTSPFRGGKAALVRHDSAGEALPPLQGEVAASLRADGGVRRPLTPDRLTEDGRLIAAPTEPGNPPSALPPAPDLRAHFDALWAASERLAAEFDDFDPEAALRDPDFLRLTAPGLGVEPRRAWLALHPESLQRRTADALRRSLASRAARPREGGRGGALPETDYRSLSRAEQQRLKERIHRAAALGEKIYP